jgi:hypothetical protein
MGEEHVANANQSSLMFSFYSDDSYEPLDIGPDPCITVIVPALNLNNMPEYESSSDEEDQQEQEVSHQMGNNKVANQRNMNTQDYE